MGDLRFLRHYERVRDAEDPSAEIRGLGDAQVVEALAAASMDRDPYLANVLATEALNRLAERARLERRLEASEARFRELSENAPVGIYRTAPDGRILYANTALAEMLGYGSVEELTAVNAADLYADPARRNAWRARVEREGVVRGFEIEKRTARGEVRWLRDTTRAVRDGLGRTRYYEGVLEDVTEWKRAQEALRESEAQLRALTAGAPVVMWATDAEGVITAAEGAMLRQRGYDPAAMVGRSAFEYISDRPDLQELLRRALAGEEVREVVEAPGGLLYETRYAPQRDGNGGVRGVVVVGTDVTDRARAERSRALLASIVDSTQDAVLSKDLDAIITSWNAAAERLYGYTAEEAVGQSVAIIVPPHRRGEERAILERVLEEGRVDHYETERVAKDGRTIHVSLSVSALREAGGRVVGASAIARDITGRKRREAELAEYRGRLEEMVAERTRDLQALNRELEAFAYRASHDVRARLRAMDHFASVLEEDFGDALGEEGRALTARLQAESARLTTLVSDLLAFSQAGRAAMTRQPVDLSAVARDVVETLRVRDPHRRVDVAVAEGVAAEGDPGLLRVALENLLENAWKYTARVEGARVEFGVQGEGGEARFFVRDNGAGFDPGSVEALFRPFERLHGEEEFEGTGVGLPTVARVVERHGGRVWAESPGPGKGATFWFTLA